MQTRKSSSHVGKKPASLAFPSLLSSFSPISASSRFWGQTSWVQQRAPAPPFFNFQVSLLLSLHLRILSSSVFTSLILVCRPSINPPINSPPLAFSPLLSSCLLSSALCSILLCSPLSCLLFSPLLLFFASLLCNSGIS